MDNQCASDAEHRLHRYADNELSKQRSASILLCSQHAFVEDKLFRDRVDQRRHRYDVRVRQSHKCKRSCEHHYGVGSRDVVYRIELIDDRPHWGGWNHHPTTTASAAPQDITAGPDGARWFTVTEYSPGLAGGTCYSIVPGPDGALWFNDGSGKIGRLTTAGSYSSFALPGGLMMAGALTFGPDGAIWFTDQTDNKIGRMTTGGVFTQHSLASGSNPSGIAQGSDGALWWLFTIEGVVAVWALRSPAGTWRCGSSGP